MERALWLLVGLTLVELASGTIWAGEPVRGEPIGGEPIVNVGAATNSAPSPAAGAAATVTNRTVTPPGAASSAKEEKYLSTGFDLLSAFRLETGGDGPVSGEAAREASEKIMKQVPASVKTLDEKQVAARGFMLPTKVESGLVTEFVLLKSQMGCCYGMAPGINEWIDVRTSGKGVKPLMDDLITVYGTLHVKDVWESGYLTGIYKMDCERVQ